MAYAYAESRTGGLYTVDDEGTVGTPIDFFEILENLKGVKTGVQQSPQNYGTGADGNNPYELCENNINEWSSAGDAGSPTNESTDVKYGSYSTKFTKTGSGVFQAYWNKTGAYTNWHDGNYKYFGLMSCRKLKFSVKPSVNMQLDQITLWMNNTSSVGAFNQYYYAYHSNNGNYWTLTAGVWNVGFMGSL
jgi:hypothetical protein